MDLRDTRILLLEDDPLISIDAEDMLLSLGARIVHVTHTLEDAAAVLAREPVDAAVLDVQIGAGRSDDLADELGRRGIPFILTSGYACEGGVPGGPDGVPSIGKPYGPEAIGGAFARMGALRRTG